MTTCFTNLVMFTTKGYAYFTVITRTTTTITTNYYQHLFTTKFFTTAITMATFFQNLILFTIKIFP
jgi:hypothetical protein